MAQHAALVEAERRLPEMLADLERLVRCESPSADHEAVARSADLVAAIGLDRLGVPAERIVVDGVAHLRWRLGAADPAAPRVLLLAHHDTVWPTGSLATHPWSIDDGVVRGPGCFDMLTGLVMAVHAAADLELPQRTAVTLLVTGDEEVGSSTSRTLIEEEARGCVAALVLEASADGGAWKVARKGVSLYRVEVVGRAAHAGLEPERGRNATVEMAHQIVAAAALGDAALGTTVTPTVAQGGSTSNTVAAHASFTVDVRAETAAEQARVDEAFHALRPVAGATIAIVGGINRPPLERTSSEPVLRRAVAVAERLGIPVPDAVSVGGASDGNYTASIGVPTLDGLGAVGGGAHADHEHALVDEIAPRTALLRALVLDLLASPVG
ncbi:MULTISPECIES: M20 family metallopeptidase [unclassified Agrococcus]|uniref:M20 family metallopeptidase n=1 Tax=unclassified Agrococcus TaxID=2615065 RepID=UPI00361B5459